MAQAEYRIGIIGSGRMGTDLFYYISEYHLPLTWVCRTADAKEGLCRTWETRLTRRYRTGVIDDETFRHKQEQTVITDRLSDISGCSVIIEAIAEDRDAKKLLLSQVGRFLNEKAIVATATSSIKPSLLAGDISWRERFAAIHFFYPIKYRNIVEVVTADWTGADTLDIIQRFLSLIGRNCIVMHERDGFILNRMILDIQALAWRLSREKGLDVRTIDSIVKRSILPDGVFEFFDAVGIDIAHRAVMNYVDDLPDRAFYEPLLEELGRLCGAGRLGRKSGAGFYDYPYSLSGSEIAGDGVFSKLSDQFMALFINSAYRALEKNICPQPELEQAIIEFLGVDRGPFALAEEIGRTTIRSMLDNYFKNTGFGCFRPSTLL